MNPNNDIYDVAIVGGGPAGSSAAIHLANNGARVLLVEQKKFPRAKLCGEFISPECLGHFRRLGVASEINAAGAVPLTETVFYSRSGRSVVVPSVWFGSEDKVAIGLSRAEMDFRLLTRARQAGVDVLEETQATDLLTADQHVKGVRLRTADGEIEIRSLITVDAGGRASILTRKLDKSRVSPKRSRARLVAFKAHLENTSGRADHCEIYVYPGGYGGLNRVEDQSANLCFITRSDDARGYGSDAAAVMRNVVMKNRRAAQTLAEAHAPNGWLAVPLESFGHKRLVSAPGLLSIGDAAGFIDPFTGSGMLMALESGQLAADRIAQHLVGLRDGSAFDKLAADYRSSYGRTFNSRFRICALMRRAAFVPRLAESLIFVLGGSDRLRRKLARSTRPSRRRADTEKAS